MNSPPPDTPICGYDNSKCPGMIITLIKLTKHIILSIENIFSCQYTGVCIRILRSSVHGAHDSRIWLLSVSLRLAIYFSN